MTFEGKNVFVTGGSSGIALAIADGMAMAGATLTIVGRKQEKLDSALTRLGRHGRGCIGVSADVRDAGAVRSAVEQSVNAFGPIDVLVSAAAGNFLADAAQLSTNGFKAVVDIDLLGTFHVMSAAWPHLRKPGASILNITAAQSWTPMQGQIHACAAKAGIDQITRTLALEWGPSGVRVNSIAPGPVSGTEGMARLAPTPESVRAWTAAVPLGRFATTQDIARAAMWLSSDDASYITGIVLSVDGGLSLGGGSAISRAMML